MIFVSPPIAGWVPLCLRVWVEWLVSCLHNLGSLERHPRRSQIRSHYGWLLNEPTHSTHYCTFLRLQLITSQAPSAGAVPGVLHQGRFF